jgi:L-lactate dehydrogenase complex protein LldF
VLRDEVGREALHCIRCSACLNVCPVYARTGGHAYGSVYPGPIGAILTPQLRGLPEDRSLPYASTLCGACYDVCPVKIDIPKILLHLRAQAPKAPVEQATLRVGAAVFRRPRAYRIAQRAARALQVPARWFGPLRVWTRSRDLRRLPRESFRDRWSRERGA